jgi:hypothetical protein
MNRALNSILGHGSLYVHFDHRVDDCVRESIRDEYNEHRNRTAIGVNSVLMYINELKDTAAHIEGVILRD